MEFRTPGGLYPTNIAVVNEKLAYVLAHPVGDGPIDMDRSVVFEVVEDTASPIRVFDIEVTALAVLGNRLYCVDGDSSAYEYDGTTWSDWPEAGGSASRISALRVVGDQVYGLGYDGIIYRWYETDWVDLNDEIEDLYLFDLITDSDGRLLATGDGGFLGKLDGRDLSRIEMPTNIDLSSVMLLSDGRLFLTGWNASVYVGRPDEMAQIDNGGRTNSFANAVQWDGKVLVAAALDILEFADGELVDFDPHPAHRLASTGDVLWLQDDDGVAVLREEGWVTVPLIADL